MNLALLLPVGLAALAALVVPILIHLIRRPEQHVIDFAALRWLSERVRPRRRLRFEDPWLLLVRLLLIAALALLLAQPVLDRDPRSARAWIAVAPTVDLAAARAALTGNAGEWHWLAPGFPAIDAPAPSPVAPIASLVRELDALLDPGAAVTLVVPATIDGLDGERLRLTRDIDWHVVADSSAPPQVTAPARGPINIAVRHDADGAASLRFIRAAVAAWNAPEPDRYVLDVQPVDRAIAGDAQWLIWIGGEPPPDVQAWIEAGGRALVTGGDSSDAGAAVWLDEAGVVLARSRSLGAGRLVRLMRPLDVQALPQLLDADFPDNLRALFEDATPTPKRAFAASIAPQVGALASSRPPFALDPLLLVLIAGLFLVERVLATRTRGAA